MSLATRLVRRWRTPPARVQQPYRQAFIEYATVIRRAHAAQTTETIAALNRKYATPVVGRVAVWSLIEQLAQCVDPADTRLGCASQQIHVLQVLESMEADGVTDRGLLLAALVHDIGKLLLLYGERPENVVCLNDPIGSYPAGIGLDQCVMQWNHDEFAYWRLRDHLPEPIAWLVRYHSLRPGVYEPLLDAKDRGYNERYLPPFRRHDQGSKSAHRLPRRPITAYRDLIEAELPRTILF
jgi:hypothetical protein